MQALFNDYLLIWRFCVVYRNSNETGSRGYTGQILLALFLALLTWLYCKVIPAQLLAKLATCTTFSALLIATIAWCKFVRGAILANNPVCAKLVPRIRRRALQCTVLAWLVLSALMAFFIAIHQLLLATTPLDLAEFIQSAMVAFMGAGALLLLTAIERSHQFGTLLAAGAILIFMFTFPWLKSCLQSGYICFLLLPLLPLICFGWFSYVFRRAGDAHWRLLNNDHIAHFFTPKATLINKPAAPPSRFIKPWPNQANGLYARILQRDSTPATPWCKLLLHSLGPGSHWSRWFEFIDRIKANPWRAAIAAILILALLWFNPPFLARIMKIFDPHGPLATMNWLLFWPVLLFQFVRFKHLRAQLGRTTRERMLLRLVARPGTMRNLNQQLERELFRSALLEWCFSTTCAILLGQLLGLNAVSLLYQLGMLSLGLPFGYLLLLNGTDSTREQRAARRNSIGLHLAVLGYLLICIIALPMPPGMASGAGWLAGISWTRLGVQLGWIAIIAFVTWQIARAINAP